MNSFKEIYIAWCKYKYPINILYTLGKDSYQKFILRARRLYSKLLKQGYIMDRLNRDSGNGMVNKGILLNNMKYLSRNVKWHFEAGKVTVTWTSKLITLYTNLWLWY